MSESFLNAPFVFLCCQGRSGSTLLLRHLNAIEGYHIMGENRGAIQQLLHFYTNIKHMDEVRSTVDDEHYKIAWLNTFDYHKIVDDIGILLKDMFWKSDKKVFGFKEISFGLDIYDKFEEELNLLHELFPNLRIIFLTRELDELLKSGWWADDPINAKKILIDQEINFITYYKKYFKHTLADGSSYLYYLTFNDMCAKTDTFVSLYDFLGEKFDERLFLDVNEKVTR